MIATCRYQYKVINKFCSIYLSHHRTKPARIKIFEFALYAHTSPHPPSLPRHPWHNHLSPLRNPASPTPIRGVSAPSLRSPTRPENIPMTSHDVTALWRHAGGFSAFVYDTQELVKLLNSDNNRFLSHPRLCYRWRNRARPGHWPHVQSGLNAETWPRHWQFRLTMPWPSGNKESISRWMISMLSNRRTVASPCRWKTPHCNICFAT